ncbi:MAG: winged helix DNA-binding domain-containing protein [Gemmatimonadaceae bacterium]|nr:winged helix DNA-binding domain-containing protein [Gemmatimonadaceae bacterium]
MTLRLKTLSDIATLRLENQHLIGPRFDEPVEAVRWLGAVQAQDYQGAKWALAQRTSSIDNAALDRSFDSGEILRTHVMRPTWHFVTPQDIRWLVHLTAPRVNTTMRSYDMRLELGDSLLKKSRTILARALKGMRYLTRKEITSVFADSGIAATGQRLAHILMHAELDALVTSGPLRGKQFTYALLEERVPPAGDLGRDESLARLAYRYFESHGPATLHDFGWWSGLTMGDVRAAVEMTKSQLVQQTMNGVTYLFAQPDRQRAKLKKPTVHLLSNYDEHLVAYRDHNPSFNPALLRPEGVQREALVAHIVTLNGFVVGGWRRTVTADRVVIETSLLKDLTLAETKALERSASDYGRFMGLPVTIGRTGSLLDSRSG